MILYPALVFLVGLWLGSYLPFLPGSILLLCSGVAVTLTWFERSGRMRTKQGIILFASLICGIVYWTGAAWMNDLAGITKGIGLRPVTVTGTVIQPVRRLPDRSVIVVAVTHVTKEQTTESTSGKLLLTWRNPDRPISQGNTIEASVRLREPYGTMNPGGFHYGTYLKRKGIHTVATVSGPGKVNIVEQIILIICRNISEIY